MSDIGARFRALHERDGAFVIPNPWDLPSARILAQAGFEALATTSWGMALGLGIPEASMPRQETLDHCRMLVGASTLPVSADLEKGFGDSPESCADTVRAAAETGLAGCSLEDHTGDPANAIFDETLSVERIAAACEARDALAGDFVLTARCETLCWGRTDLDEVIRRLQAYEAAGADVLYAPGLPDLEAIRTVCRSLGKPVNVVMGMAGATYSVADLVDAGVTRISVGSLFARLAYGGLIQAAQSIRQQGTFDCSADALGFDAFDALMR